MRSLHNSLLTGSVFICTTHMVETKANDTILGGRLSIILMVLLVALTPLRLTFLIN